METFTLTRNFNDEPIFTGHLTVYENGTPIQTYKIESETREGFEHRALVTRAIYLETKKVDAVTSTN